MRTFLCHYFHLPTTGQRTPGSEPQSTASASSDRKLLYEICLLHGGLIGSAPLLPRFQAKTPQSRRTAPACDCVYSSQIDLRWRWAVQNMPAKVPALFQSDYPEERRRCAPCSLDFHLPTNCQTTRPTYTSTSSLCKLLNKREILQAIVDANLVVIGFHLPTTCQRSRPNSPHQSASPSSLTRLKSSRL